MNRRAFVAAAVAMGGLVIGMMLPKEDQPNFVRGTKQPSEFDPDARWRPSDAALIRTVLRYELEGRGGRSSYLTTTPRARWDYDADHWDNWEGIPAEVLNAVPELMSRFRPVDGVCLRRGHVRDKETDEQAWIKWFTIRRRHSETRVEVEDVVWCSPLGGGASTRIYELVDGVWESVETIEDWVS